MRTTATEDEDNLLSQKFSLSMRLASYDELLEVMKFGAYGAQSQDMTILTFVIQGIRTQY